jgi:pimeloyl-ACP methyl ester carboxylesterase
MKCVGFAHGTPWSSVVFQPIAEALLAKGTYQILVYDLPDYGQSQDFDSSSSTTTSTSTSTSEEDFPGDTSVKFQVLALTDLLKHVQMDGQGGHQAPAIIAHDIAGAIVLQAHLLHGCEFDIIMLLDANTVLPWGDRFCKLVRAELQTFVNLPPNILKLSFGL